MGKLTTHVLDTAGGRPAAGVNYALYKVAEGAAPTLISSGVTNQDGRTDAPLIDGQPLEIGQYQLVFAVGPYFKALGWDLPEPNFLDQIPIFFGVNDPNQHYHVPLLVSPFSYSTYRGS
ncbi:MAG: hydroxyisourate hydrolase [Alphaproteobacteria bacterium]